MLRIICTGEPQFKFQVYGDDYGDNCKSMIIIDRLWHYIREIGSDNFPIFQFYWTIFICTVINVWNLRKRQYIFFRFFSSSKNEWWPIKFSYIWVMTHYFFLILSGDPFLCSPTPSGTSFLSGPLHVWARISFAWNITHVSKPCHVIHLIMFLLCVYELRNK